MSNINGIGIKIGSIIIIFSKNSLTQLWIFSKVLNQKIYAQKMQTYMYMYVCISTIYNIKAKFTLAFVAGSVMYIDDMIKTCSKTKTGITKKKIEIKNFWFLKKLEDKIAESRKYALF